LYDMFMADGLIQGVFFDQGEMQFVRENIDTEKRKKRGWWNPFDISNTNILSIENALYSFFEHNNPYQLDLSFAERTLKTVRKRSVPNVRLFSGHTKYNPLSKRITTLDYNVFNKDVHLYSLNSEFSLLKKQKIRFSYVPMIHDFYTEETKVFLVDAPFYMKWFPSSWKNMISFDNKKNTFIYCVHEDSTVEKYESDESFFLFHYATVRETEKEIEIYAPLYESIDFSNMDIHGRYRRIVLDKQTKKARVERNEELEKYAVDFPIVDDSRGYVILRQLDPNNNKSNGFLVCCGLKIIDTILLPDPTMSICGEPSLIVLRGRPCLLFFFCTFQNNHHSWIGLLDIQTKELEMRELKNVTLTVGFHSLFVPTK